MNTHLDALMLRLSNERMRYASDNSPIRKVWIEQMEREIAGELKFIDETLSMSDDDLLSELMG